MTLVDQVTQELRAAIRSQAPVIRTAERSMLIEFDGYQSEFIVRVRYIYVPPRVALCDEPGAGAYVEVMSCIIDEIDLSWLLGPEVIKALAADLLKDLE